MGLPNQEPHVRDSGASRACCPPPLVLLWAKPPADLPLCQGDQGRSKTRYAERWVGATGGWQSLPNLPKHGRDACFGHPKTGNRKKLVSATSETTNAQACQMIFQGASCLSEAIWLD